MKEYVYETSEESLTTEISDKLVFFNVSGKVFATTSSTLNNFPNSLLGEEWKRNRLRKTKDGAIFFNRNPDVFQSILTFYQCGIFEQSPRVNQLIFVRDVHYYGLTDEAMQSGLKGFHVHQLEMPKRKWQAFLWSLFESPESSTAARITSLLSILTIILSIAIFCIETLPAYKASSNEESTKITKAVLNNVEIVCIAYFTLELILRFIACPNKCTFIKDVLNIIDFISILPFYIMVIFNLDGHVSIYFLRVIRLVRVFRVFKLTRHSSEMKILAIAVKDSGRELGVLIFFILLGVLLFSSAVYYAEAEAPGTKLTSIPAAFWWSIVTMTTVGYGDELPLSIVGRIVGALCAMTGILVIAMPIPIIVNNFTQQYEVLKPPSKYWLQLQNRLKKTSSQRKDVKSEEKEALLSDNSSENYARNGKVSHVETYV